MKKVITTRKTLTLPTYPLGEPEKNPLFFEKRVYQGSCGKVYPVPFIDKVYDNPEDYDYDSVRMENDFVRLVLLPEIGGRIFLGQDKVNDDYDFFYRQDEIKPALVGLAGPWISGGVEFNWPQHHRPGTYMPTDVHVEECEDGSHITWMSEHDPLNRLKGMHGVKLFPDSSLVELKARLYNRTPYTQTFLWWANVAAEVHDQYQSFFPPDVHYVADHAVRDQSSFPVAQNDYYGIDYANRDGANDLSLYKNIPVPTSYMVCDTRFSFFGGYDFAAKGGFIHVANPHVSPGKKQWTWGNHEFGWAWDRELTDRVGPTGRPAPYVELMAGVYTDNQPDFTYLQPYETKTFSQFWWPYKDIGPVQNATKDAAVRLVDNEDGTLSLGAVASRKLENVRILLQDGSRVLIDEQFDLSPETPWHKPAFDWDGKDFYSLELSVGDWVSYQPIDVSKLERNRELATEPPLPAEIDTIEELYLTAEHLEQYRHPTRYPELYWDEILRRDPQDVRTNIAYGRKRLYQGKFVEAKQCFEKAIGRLTKRHPNPCTGEAHYYLGLTCRLIGQYQAAYAALYKATWNYEWRSCAYYELACLDCKKQDWDTAIKHCEESLICNQSNHKARVVKAMAMKRLGLDPSEELKAVLKIDPLDHWARFESGDVDGFIEKTRNDAQTVLDVAYDYADAGFYEEAISLLIVHHSHEINESGVPNPLARSQQTQYVLAWLRNDTDLLSEARSQNSDYFFPSRLHDQIVLEWAVSHSGDSSSEQYALGNYYFDRKRHEDAIEAWEKAGDGATVLRNLGIAYWNVRSDGESARNAYLQAIAAAPDDARIFAEYDQLREKLGDRPEDRLEMLLSRPDLVNSRDDASVALATLYNETGFPDKALELVNNRRFHPWEGGEGKVLKQYTTARLLLGQKAMSDDPESALKHFELAMSPPENLGEAYHLLQAKADVNYWIGKALLKLGKVSVAKEYFESSANEAGDFLGMEVVQHSELSYYRGLSMVELQRFDEAKKLFEDLQSFAEKEMNAEAKIDYFATSLPLLLVFEDDLNELKRRNALRLLDFAKKGLNSIRRV